MARVEVRSQSWGTLWDLYGNVQVGQLASIDTTVYAASSGGTEVTPGNFYTGGDGTLPGWVDEGDWILTIDDDDYGAPAVSGTLPPRVGALESDQVAQDVEIAARAPNVALPILTKNYAMPTGGNDSPALADAFDDAEARGGDVIEARAGTHSFATKVDLPPRCSIIGAGASTIFRASGDNFILGLRGLSGGGPSYQSRVAHVWFQGPAGGPQAAGGALDFTDAEYNLTVDHIWLGDNLYYGLFMVPGQPAGIWTLDRVRWNGVAGCMYAIEVGSGADLLSDVTCTRFVGTGASPADMARWLFVRNGVDTLSFGDSLFTGGDLGAVIGVDGAPGSVTNPKFTNFVLDTLDSEGFNIQKCSSLDLTACGIQGCGNATLPGLRVGPSANSVRVLGGNVNFNDGDGIVINEGAANTKILGTDILSNNLTNQAFGSGVSISADASDIDIDHCPIGNGVLTMPDVVGNPGPAGHQKYGVLVAGGGGDYIRLGRSNRYAGNENAAILNAATGIHNEIDTGLGAANPDTSGASLATLETEVNQVKALLRARGLMPS